MDRRKFLRIALGAGAVAIAVPELLVPRRTIILPPRGGWPVGDVRRYGAVGDGYQAWRWNADTQERYRSLFVSIQQAEWIAHPMPMSPGLEQLYAYARGGRG